MTSEAQQATIILASGSPRRQQFLRELGLDFRIVVADIDETPYPNEHPPALAQRLAEAKARAVAQRLEPLDLEPARSAVIIAADTVVALGEELLGKPGDAAEATQMLLQLQNKTHMVHSSVSLLDTRSGRQATRVNSTQVQMRNYTADELRAYVASGDPLDKAGAYAIQHPTFAPVCALQGCVSGVIGLPLADLRELLATFDIKIRTPLPPICEQQTIFACCQVR
ncbi:MAG: Maf family protein [Caldilineaceae bacterium]